MTSPAIRARALSKRYPNGVVGLDGLDLTLPRGAFAAIVGPSGAGKTTLFRLLNGAIRPSDGELEVLGESMDQISRHRLRRLRRRVAMVYQLHNLVPSLPVFLNVRLGLLGRLPLWRALLSAARPSPAEIAVVHGILAELDLAEKLWTRTEDLSGGQQQRVAIARALLQDAELIVADEPVASLDEGTARLILDALERRNLERGVTVLVSLHQPALVERYCRQVVELRGGKLGAFHELPRGRSAEAGPVHHRHVGSLILPSTTMLEVE